LAHNKGPRDLLLLFRVPHPSHREVGLPLLFLFTSRDAKSVPKWDSLRTRPQEIPLILYWKGR
jgi:hypothetical protein